MKKTVLVVLDVIGALMVAFAGLSGLVMFVFGSGRASFDDPTIIWFAPLFLTPLALVGIGMMLVSSLVSKKRRGLLGWSCLAFVVLLAMTAAVFNLTGLSSGELEPQGTFWGTVAVIVSLIYALAMVELSGVGAEVARAILKMEPTHRRSSGTPAATA